MFCDQFVGDRLSLDVRQSGEGIAIHHTTLREFCNMKNATTSARSVTQNMTSTQFLSPWSNSFRIRLNQQRTHFMAPESQKTHPTDRPTDVTVSHESRNHKRGKGERGGTTRDALN